MLANLVAIRHRLFGALDMAEEYGAYRQVLGDLGVGHHNVLVMPQYVEMRVALVNALLLHPEAARAVAAVLHAIESKAAADIEATDAGRKMANGSVPALIEAKAVAS